MLQKIEHCQMMLVSRLQPLARACFSNWFRIYCRMRVALPEPQGKHLSISTIFMKEVFWIFGSATSSGVGTFPCKELIQLNMCFPNCVYGRLRVVAIPSVAVGPNSPCFTHIMFS